MLERVARRDPSWDPQDATRVDCIAALARVVVEDGFAASFGARAIDPSPGLPPLLATPARREAARRASKASEARRAREGHREQNDATEFIKRLAPPARFTAADIADGAVRVSRALATSDDPVEVAVSTEAVNTLAETSDANLNDFSERFARLEETASERTSARTTLTTFAAGGCSLDPRDGADRVARVAAMLVDLARKQAAFVLREGEPKRAANEGRPCVVRLRLEFGGADGVPRGGGLGQTDTRKGVSARQKRGGGGAPIFLAGRTRERARNGATWTTMRLVASLVAPRDAKRVPRSERAALVGEKKKSAKKVSPDATRGNREKAGKERLRLVHPFAEGSFSDTEEDGEVYFEKPRESEDVDACLTRAALAATAAAMGGCFTREPATGPDAVGDAFACAFPLLAQSALDREEGRSLSDDDDDDDVESFRLEPKLPELFAPEKTERLPGEKASAFPPPRRETRDSVHERTRLEAVFHPSVSSGRRAHCRRILETYPGTRVTTAKTAEAAAAATAAALRGGSFALVGAPRRRSGDHRRRPRRGGGGGGTRDARRGDRRGGRSGTRGAGARR